MRLVVLGDPVAHSRSPAIHTAAMRAVGLEGVYEARRVDEAGLRTACDELRDGRLDGANVTMPHKALAAACADRLEGDAGRIGAVNTLTVEAGVLVGLSTDVGGIRDVWAGTGFPDEAPALVLGAGGAAAAALAALEGRRLFVSARRPGAGRETARRVRVACEEIPWGRPVEGAVVVNATPLGMSGEVLPDALTRAASGLFDMAYGDRPTPAVVDARRRSLPVADGLAMLVAQAARSFEVWTGIAPPRRAMEAAARRGAGFEGPPPSAARG